MNMNKKGIQFQTIAVLLIVIVVIIGVVVLFTSQMGGLAGIFGGLTTATGEQGSEAEGTIGTLPGLSGQGCPTPPNCELKACIGQACEAEGEQGICLDEGVCGGYTGGPCGTTDQGDPNDADCLMAGDECLEDAGSATGYSCQ